MAIKRAISVLIAIFYLLSVKAQGSDCTSPIGLVLDGVMNNYPASSTTGTSVVCTAYATTSPVTWFSFTTGAAVECPLLNITASDHGNCEVALYTGCGGNMANNLDIGSSMCFDDGEGLWAPSETFSVQANHTYYLRVKTSSACTISIAGQYSTPSNNNCAGAKPISTSSFSDNNACNKPSTEVTPGQLCAFTLENTAFYKFYVASTGSAIININSIACDNGNGNSSSGFQIGFFTGSCGALVPVNCTSGSGSFVQGTTNPLPAGSLVYVAIDGVSGSNCQYSISGINVWGTLSTNFKNFSAWKSSSGNQLKWLCLNDSCSYYLIERSNDGTNFHAIGRINHPNRFEPSFEYTFEDASPSKSSFYRVKQIDRKGSISVSQVISVLRSEIDLLKMTVQNPVVGFMNLKIETDSYETIRYIIINSFGQCFYEGSIICSPGEITLSKDITALATGRYSIILRSKRGQVTRNFVKLN